MSEIKLEILSRETVKPSSPTPHHLRTIDLSYKDVRMLPIFFGALFFYVDDGSNSGDRHAQVSGKLKKSLSQTLTLFYPYAGKMCDRYIDCNDEGAVFIDARAGFPLSDLLRKPDTASMIVFLPDGRPKDGSSPQLFVQVTFFSCGGFVLGICLSHKFCDVTSLSAFIHGWSAIANGRSVPVIPDFAGISRVFPSPPEQEPFAFPKQEENHDASVEKPKYVTRRFVLGAEQIELLKNRATSEHVKDPTKFESIASFLWRSATRATRSINGVSKPSMMQFSLDGRRRNISPLLTENSMGNIIFNINVEANNPAMGLRELVKKLREDKKNAVEKLRTMEPIVMAEEFEKTAMDVFYKNMSGAIEGHNCTSWGRTGFYDMDLGFGNPIWVTPDSLDFGMEMFVLMDTRDGQGTEVWVSLKVQVMSEMEKDDEFLDIVTHNPSVV